MKALDRFANAVPLAAAAATGPRAFQATLAAVGTDPQPLALSLLSAPGAPDPCYPWLRGNAPDIMCAAACVLREWVVASTHIQLFMHACWKQHRAAKSGA